MGIDIKWLGDDNVIQLTLSDDVLKIIYPSVIELEGNTGVFLDPYSDTRISPDHARGVLKLLESSKEINDPIFVKFLEILKCSAESNRWILAIGD